METTGWTPDLVTVLALGSGGGVLALAGLFVRRTRSSILLAGLVLLVAGGLALARQPLVISLALGLLAVFWLGCHLVRFTRPRVYGLVVLALLPVAGGLWLDFGRPSQEEIEAQIIDEAKRPVDIKAYHALFLYTDRGRRVQTYESVGAVPSEHPSEVEAAILTRFALDHRVIRVAGPDLVCNCHGWTFGGGQCWLNSAEAEQILGENGYNPVPVPRCGDVVVYENGSGHPIHSGVVVGLDRAGEVLVESKWAWIGLYIHSVENQPYSTRWEFYHSERPDNSLYGVPGGNSQHASIAEAH